MLTMGNTKKAAIGFLMLTTSKQIDTLGFWDGGSVSKLLGVGDLGIASFGSDIYAHPASYIGATDHILQRLGAHVHIVS